MSGLSREAGPLPRELFFPARNERFNEVGEVIEPFNLRNER